MPVSEMTYTVSSGTLNSYYTMPYMVINDVRVNVDQLSESWSISS